MGLLGNKTHHLNDYIFQFVKKKELLGLYLGGRGVGGFIHTHPNFLIDSIVSSKVKITKG